MTQPLTATLRFVGHTSPQVIAASESISALLGFAAAQFLDGSVTWTALVHLDDQDITERLFAEDRQPAQRSCNIRLRHQDGRIRCVKLDYRWEQPDAQPAVLELQLTDEQAQQALAENEHRFKTIFDQLPAVSVQGYNRARQVIFWNHASEILYGYTREQAMGQRLEELIIPQPMRQAVAGFVTDWTNGGSAIPAAELTLQNAKGQPVEVFSSHVMFTDTQGEPEMYCVDTDISQRKQADQGLRASESFLRTIIDEIPDPLVLKDQQGNFLLCNQATARLYNTTPAAMVGKHDGDFGVPQDLADAMRKSTLAIMARGVADIVFEDSRDAATGELRHYRSIKKPLKDCNGQDQILVVAQDITDVIRVQRQLKESELRLLHVLEVTRESIWDWHLPSGTVQHNRQWFEALCYAEGEIASTMQSFVSLIHPDDRAQVSQRINDLLEGTVTQYNSEHRMLRKDGQAIWVRDRGQVVQRDAQDKPERLVGSFTDITLQKAQQQYLERIAHYDDLTDLPNRVLLADRMHQAMLQAKRRGTRIAVVYLDLDGFKAINDRHGHAMGDRLLAEIATRLKLVLREGDTIARLGGDEFVAVLVDLADVDDSLALVDRLLQGASHPTVLDDMTLNVSASMGVSFYPQTDDTDADQLLRQADQAMYGAKLAGKNRYQLFDAEHDRTLRVKNESIGRVHQALAQQEFVLYYQPKVNLRTGKVVGAEALIRWQHPERGLLAPAAFLADIEGHALGIALGEWVISTALQQIETWSAQALNLAVSVNIAAHHLQQANFAKRLTSLMAAHPRVPHGQLELEVLETTALEELDAVVQVMLECAQLGVSFALDDFGTGYSSLAYLKRLPAHTLKIDQCFIRDMLDDPEDRAIVEGVLGLAKAFSRQAVAEGAETQAHCKMLLQLGCDLAQGYGIARPMPAEQMPQWCANWRPDPAWGRTSVTRCDADAAGQGTAVIVLAKASS
ncbi:EAL domain-containing protein [Rhodoferax antarcticus]|uniref:EAL, GGDEF, PAS domain-containing sensory box protein n=1 Tax=Rhodoferax antarcticus ANT.BR TaxID=1111071 RepID=A0A1Q8Y9X5_9BURK|nr:EAL domain-containing protein [Rhodoferax antarcticus]APW46962.1 hypothetical protein RA876_12010 [Rhodoferax antarcticus]OLP04808.1 EAL, GGDEF, PAS domain-containing sensory box protein [Rhodoferax antarcticus ANT.BR]